MSEKTYEQAIADLVQAFMETGDDDAFRAGLLAIRRDFEPPEIKQLRQKVADLWEQANPERQN